MNNRVQAYGLSAGIIGSILLGLNLPSAASTPGASELKTAPVNLSNFSASPAINAPIRTVPNQDVTQAAAAPEVSFTDRTETGLGLSASSLSVSPSDAMQPHSFASPLVVAQATDPQLVQAEPAPVELDVQSPPDQLPPAEQVVPTSVDPGRATRSGRSYVGVGANLGAIGDSSIGDTGLIVYSKIGLSNYFSVRPGVTTNFVDGATFLLPATFDFAPIRLGSIAGNGIRIAPYIGAGLAVTTDGDVGPLLTGGLDIPINARLTATAGVNAGFMGDVDFGGFIGVGYNF
ncbi:MAG: hypothetical protein MH252_08080 [Thermosynechococcaceae cyanobacterium MS004]|nr:hypothetical protein [Thermosynechococcaceae cyanobacterium MS004]